MNKYIVQVALLACSLSAMAAQTTSLTQKQVRDPRQLEAILEANALDAETRLTAAGVTTAADIVLTNSANAGTASITANVDKNDDAGDANRILVPDGGGFKFQNDSASQGTLADILAFGATGIVTLKGGATLDNTASATELNITETTVKVTGALTVTGTTTLGTGLTGLVKASSGVISAATLVDADVSATAAIAQSKIATNNLGAATIAWTCAGNTNHVLTLNAQGIVTGYTATAP